MEAVFGPNESSFRLQLGEEVYLSFGFGSVWFPTFGNNSLLRPQTSESLAHVYPAEHLATDPSGRDELRRLRCDPRTLRRGIRRAIADRCSACGGRIYARVIARSGGPVTN